MQLNKEQIKDREKWASAGIRLPEYDVSAVAAHTNQSPAWVHFGAGNIFRGFIATLQQRLLNEKLTDTGIVAVETYDQEIIDRIYTQYDNLTLNAILNKDASMDLEVIGSVSEAIKCDQSPQNMARLEEIFTLPQLQMVSFTITEKGYALHGADGAFLPVVQADLQHAPDQARHVMSIVTALLYRRYLAGAHRLAVVSMDNCSQNGDKLKASILTIAKKWADNDLAEKGFVCYLEDEDKVSFPWSMIDKITPRPSEAVAKKLSNLGIEAMSAIITEKKTYIAPFVNAERPQYLVIEDRFPNGRPPLEHAGVFFTDRATVGQVEQMKVTTCLNPLHTAMSIFGCLLGFTSISAEMQDTEITALVKRLGYTEGLPVVTDPKILSPKAFLDEVVGERLPNPFIPDTPQRIATDTSQKVGIRFGETIHRYIEQERSLDTLIAIPLAIAGWLRYLLGIDDNGCIMPVSDDPLLPALQKKLSGVHWDQPDSVQEILQPILSNKNLFGLDLTATSLAERITEYFRSMLQGKGAVRNTLKEALQHAQ